MLLRGRNWRVLTFLTAIVGVALVYSTSVAQERLERVHPVVDDTSADQSTPAGPAADEIQALIEQLGAPEYAVRERASRRLLEIGAPALGALSEAMESGSPEVAWRARGIHEHLVAEPGPGSMRRVEPEETPSPGVERRPPSRARLFDELPEEFQRLRELHEQRMQELDGFMDSLHGSMDRGFGGFRSFEVPGFRTRDLDRLVAELFEGFDRELSEPTPRDLDSGDESVVIRQFSMERSLDSQLGLELETAQPVLRAQLDLEDGQGLVVNRVLEDSAAARAGLQQYDVIVSVAGTAVGSFSELQQAIANQDQPVTVELRRGGETRQLQMTIR